MQRGKVATHGPARAMRVKGKEHLERMKAKVSSKSLMAALAAQPPAAIEPVPTDPSLHVGRGQRRVNPTKRLENLQQLLQQNDHHRHPHHLLPQWTTTRS